MSKIDDLNTQPKFDNALQVARTASIPSNEKYTAAEWNALISKTNEVVGRANLNTWDIVTNYSELPTDPVNGQKVYVTGTGLTGHVSVQMMVNGKSSRGFYVYDAFSDIWAQKTSESVGGGYIEIKDQFNDVNGHLDLDLITDEGLYYSVITRDQDLNGIPGLTLLEPHLINVEVRYNNLSETITQKVTYFGFASEGPNIAYRIHSTGFGGWTAWRYMVDDNNGVTPTATASVVTSYDIDPQTETEHWNLTMTGDTDFNFANMFASGHSKVITITLSGDYAFTLPSWLKPLATSDDYDTMGGTLAAEIVINIKNGGTNPSGYYNLQMIDYAS